MAHYPLHMKHPAHRPAVKSGMVRNEHGKVIGQDPPGQPEKFPDVWVNNTDQEQHYATLGYVPVGEADPKTYLKRITDGPDSLLSEYPKFMYRKSETKVVNTPEEAQALGADWGDVPGFAPVEKQREEIANGEATSDSQKVLRKKRKMSRETKIKIRDTMRRKAAERKALEAA